jgi:hypothetical protein
MYLEIKFSFQKQKKKINNYKTGFFFILKFINYYIIKTINKSHEFV